MYSWTGYKSSKTVQILSTKEFSSSDPQTSSTPTNSRSEKRLVHVHVYVPRAKSEYSVLLVCIKKFVHVHVVKIYCIICT